MEALSFDNEGDSPLYRQLAERICELIFEGTFETGRRLPSIRKLGRQLSLSKTTVVEAFRLLEAWGLVEARPRSGYFVQPPHLRRSRAGAEIPDELAATPSLIQTTSGGHDPQLRMMVAGADRKVLRLGVALPSPHYFPIERLSKILAREVRRAPSEALRYGALSGYKELRVQIARRAVSAGVSISPEDVIITNGASEALLLSLRAVIEPGQCVAVASPTFYVFVNLLEMCGVEAVEIATDAGAGMQVDALRQALEDKDIGAIFLDPSVSNPGGWVMPDERKQAIVELARSHRVPIIEDDVNAELVYASRRPKSLKAFDNTGDVLWCGSFSKTLAPGFRVGWVVPGRRRERVAKLKSSTSFATGTPQQMAIAEFSANGSYDHHLKQLRRVYRASTNKMRRLVESHFPAATSVRPPDGGHLLWVELPAQVDSLALAEQAQADGISIGPGPVFSPSNRFSNFIRLNCAVVWTPEVDQAIERLGQMACAQLS